MGNSGTTSRASTNGKTVPIEASHATWRRSSRPNKRRVSDPEMNIQNSRFRMSRMGFALPRQEAFRGNGPRHETAASDIQRGEGLSSYWNLANGAVRRPCGEPISLPSLPAFFWLPSSLPVCELVYVSSQLFVLELSWLPFSLPVLRLASCGQVWSHRCPL